MPYKDPDKNREYQREWANRRRSGVETKIVNNPKVSEEEKNAKRKASQMKYRHQRKMQLAGHLGSHCFFCNVHVSEKRLSAHRKDGKEHNDLHNMKKVDFLKEIASGAYERVCYKCHKHVHWCMDALKMSWDEIVERFLV